MHGIIERADRPAPQMKALLHRLATPAYSAAQVADFERQSAAFPVLGGIAAVREVSPGRFEIDWA
jgi:hypothetical protein